MANKIIKYYITNTYLKQARTATNQDGGTTQQEGKVMKRRMKEDSVKELDNNQHNMPQAKNKIAILRRAKVEAR